MMKAELTVFQLKVIALITMTIDHIGYYLISPSDPSYVAFRLIGRIAFILFAFLAAEAMSHTRHPWRYVLVLAIFGIAFDTVAYLAMGEQIGNIFLTLALGAFAIRLIQYKKWWSIAAILPLTLMVWGPYVGLDFYYDYGMYGTAAIVLFYFARQERVYAILGFMALTFTFYAINSYQWGFQSYSLLAVPFIALYRGNPGFRHPVWKWFNYIYYPAHILILYGLSTIL